jgi:hypothetical protein
MSLLFPRLKHLILIRFNTKALTLFLDCLQNLTELYEITIHQVLTESIYTNELQTLLYRLLVANNPQLNSLIFDWYSNPFSVDIGNNNIGFINIERLYINLKTIKDLHRILTVFPRLCRLYTRIHGQCFEYDAETEYFTVPTLKYFHLRSFSRSWYLA